MTLVRCSPIAIRSSGYLNAFYRRIKERRGGDKAIIAAARRLLAIVLDTLMIGSSRPCGIAKISLARSATKLVRMIFRWSIVRHLAC